MSSSHHHHHERSLHPFPYVQARPANPHREALLNLDTPADLAAYLLAERERLRALLAQGAQLAVGSHPVDATELGIRSCYAFSDLTDAFLARLLALASVRAGVDALSPPIALIATGGYGRRELCPYSDIDLTFVPLRDADPRIDRLVREMFTQIMDICIGKCGLKVGYAYRMLDECSALDHQTITGLLDARLVAGSERLFIQFEDAFWECFNPAEFIFAKLEERRRNLTKWGTVARVVEPQLKEGPGGLRDFQTVVWLVQAHEQLVAARLRGGRCLEALHREGYLTHDEALRFGDAREMLFMVRNILHAMSGAPRDILVRTRQEEVASRLGYDRQLQEQADTTRRGTLSVGSAKVLEDAPPVERFMANLYPHMAFVRRIAHDLMERVENSRMMLGVGLDCEQRRIVPANGALESEDPLWMLWACELAQRYGLTLDDGVRQACETLLAMQPCLSDVHAAAQIFTRILSVKGRVYPIFQIMADLGVLGWFIPEFGRVMDLIPYDPAHEYTVGQHTLYLLRNLDELFTAQAKERTAGNAVPVGFHPEQWDEMQQVMQGLGSPEQLMLAALLHDCGKALPGGTHADIGAVLAQEVCRRLEWSERATGNVVFLIQHHLLMAETSRLRDLNLEETIRQFAETVGDADRLDMLYLLTYADTRAVGEGIWTQLNGRFLQELWQRTSAFFGAMEQDTAGPVDVEERLARARRRMMRDLKPENLPDEEVAEHVHAMPPTYLLNTSPNQIAAQIGMVRRARQGEVVVEYENVRDATYTGLTVCALDDPRPGLLAKITGVLYASELVGHSAQVFTRITEVDRIALDTLWVDFRGRQLASGKQQEVASWLRAVLKGELPLEELLERQRSKFQLFGGRGNGASKGGSGGLSPAAMGSNGVSTRVRSVRNDFTGQSTLIEIEEPDVRGALFWTSQAMARLGWDIESARVSIFHGVARGSFYVTGLRAYTEESIVRLLEGALHPLE